MLKDLRIFHRNPSKNPNTNSESNENLPVNPEDSASIQMAMPAADSSRPPLNSIPEPTQNPRSASDQELGLRSKIDRTPSKIKSKGSDLPLPHRTPEKHSRARFGWGPRTETGTNVSETDVAHGSSRFNTTPRSVRTMGRAVSNQSESSSTQSTPTKSVSKPNYSGFGPFGGSRPPLGTGARVGSFNLMSKGLSVSSGPPLVVNTVDVPHFELREDPSFWMDHNVQVLIRVRPLNSTERSLQGYNRCLKQESAQSIAWIGQPESRFTFDHVACESVNQEMLFRVAGLPMVENCLSGYNSCMFAYGQTGSGKTYTMLGEIDELEIRPSLDRGMTPRIFEFLFARIRAEEESRQDEKLKYYCKCSFLEIYNEQITDLLDPSSTNLLLREDIKKGVYVENLTEYEVETVNDIIRLLIQGAANRKVAATNMNRESSRSHSVFTCVIESRWEKDSTTNLRFARLNLVDLAGSERQKTSGAEGERLKEAANINKSLSTLGHVIMVLVDVAHGKQRHVPYRDSRLTFLLQDSLGGNSKTMIIANVSPSICCSGETLSTLKFAQRAKLIQNNAVVNEDASGDVIALQHQIRLLKEELFVLKRQNVSRSLSFRSTIFGDFVGEGCDSDTAPMEIMGGVSQGNADNSHGFASSGSVSVSTKQLKSLEATLAGALRREKMADTTIKQLEAEIEQLNRLVRQREEYTRSTKMTLRFREDKIRRMESLLDGLMPADSYLIEENSALSDEIHLLRTQVDRNPEVTRFALENIRLLDQLRRFQDFYEEGEREILLAEVSELRDQLVQFLDGKFGEDKHPNLNMTLQEVGHVGFDSANTENDSLHEELKNTHKELEGCRSNLNSCLEINAKLTREIDDLCSQLNNLKSVCSDQYVNIEHQKELYRDSSSTESQTLEIHMLEAIQKQKAEWKHEVTMKHTEEIMNLQLEVDILKIILEEERSSCCDIEERALRVNNDFKMSNERYLQISKKYEDAENELKDVRSVIEALESQQILSINEMEDLRDSNNQYVELLRKQEQEISALKKQIGLAHQVVRDQTLKQSWNEDSPLQSKLKRMQDSLEKARTLNMRYQSDEASNTSHEREMDEVRRQVEAETAEVIICLQEELATLQQQIDDSNANELGTKQNLMLLEIESKELQRKLDLATDDNQRLGELLEEKEAELRSLTEEWERVGCEISEVLSDGNMELEDASDQVEFIADSFPQRTWIGEQVGRMMRIISEKELLIEELQKCLEDAQNIRSDMEWKLRSLRGATLAITEAQQQESSEKEKEVLLLTSQLSEKMSLIMELENMIKLGEDQFRKAEIRATAAFMTVNRLSEINSKHLEALKHVELRLNESMEMELQKDALLQDQILATAKADKQIQALKLELEISEVNTAKVNRKLEEELERLHAMERQLEKVEKDITEMKLADDLVKTKEKVSEFKMRVCTLNSCMSEYIEKVGGSEIVISPEKHDVSCGEGDSGRRTGIETTQGVSDKESHYIRVMSDDSDSIVRSAERCFHEEIACVRTLEGVCDRDITILLLRKEIESALNSLRGVQDQMSKLLEEREENKKSEKNTRTSIECLTGQILGLQTDMDDKEKQFEIRMQELDRKLETVEEIAEEANACWCLTKEVLEVELSNAKIIAAQKTTEASGLLANFEEAQETIVEADVVVNALTAANETAKLEIEKYKKIEITLTQERDYLIKKVQSLDTSNDLKEQQYGHLEKQFHSNLAETRSLILALEDIFMQVQTTFNQEFKLIVSGTHELQSQLLHSTNLTRSWLEDIWSEIIGKDCAVSILHLCHMGILLETVTGLNAENGFLHHGLCESNSVISDLREHNFRAKKELEMCSILKGKLLVDIKNSFNRITRKEDETGKLSDKLSSFEKKIVDLQLQEESMLARSNSMGSELAILMKDLEMNNSNTLTVLLNQEKLLKEKDELYHQLGNSSRLLEKVRFHHELFRDSVCKGLDFLIGDTLSESLINLNNLKSVNIELKEGIEYYKELIECQTDLIMMDFAAKDFELLILGSEMKQNIMVLNQREIEIERMNAVNGQNDILKGRLGEAHEARERLSAQVQILNADTERLYEELRMKEAALVSSSTHISALDLQNQKLQVDVGLLQASISGLQTELGMMHEELNDIKHSKSITLNDLESGKIEMVNLSSEMDSMKEENQALKDVVKNLKDELSKVIEDLQGKRAESESSSSRLHAFDQENRELQEKVCSLEVCITTLQTDLDLKIAELAENEALKDEVKNLEDELSKVFENLQEKRAESESSYSQLHAFEQENHELQDKVCSLEACITTLQTDLDLKIAELAENEVLKDEVKNLKDELSKVIEDLQGKRAELESSSSRLRAFEQENRELQDKVFSLEACITTLQTDLDMQISELVGNEALKDEVKNLKDELSKVFEDLQGKTAESESSLSRLHAFDQENHKLQDKVCSLEACFTTLQADLDMKIAELVEVRCSSSVAAKDLDLKTRDVEIQLNKMNALKEENNSLENDLACIRLTTNEILTLLRSNVQNCSASVQAVDLIESKIIHVLDGKNITLLDEMFQEICVCKEKASKFMVESEFLEMSAKEMVKENSSLQAELLRKDEVLEGLLFDLSLLQESASNAKDQKDEYEEMVATLESLEDDLAQKSSELDEAISRGQMLEFELLKEQESLKHVSDENIELKTHMEELLLMRNSIEEELLEKSRVAESLERELVEMSSAIGRMNDLVKDLKSDLCKVTNERDCLDSEVLVLKEQLEMAQAFADENEAIAVEARQIAEARKNYAEDKEEEVKLLEKSVEELESTVNVLENKVEIVKGETERQRLQREELELELQTVKHQLLTVQASGAIVKAELQNVTKGGCGGLPRHLEEKVSDLQEAHKQIQILEKNIAEKDAEIVQCKAHISELNMHAEAQAHEYKLKFKELEAMAQYVKPESTSSHVANLNSTKSEKHAVKSRGSGSPFKCIGLGLTQQINSEKDEELNAGRLRIEELEALAASRQKEIFMLNTRLAAADSMTHDVIRDLLGVKLDMTNYALLLDHHQVQKITEKARFQSEDSLEKSSSAFKEQEVIKLKQQLNEVIEERQGWLDEINRRQAELVAARIALEKLRHRDQSLTTENEMLKMDNVNHKKKVMELEDELKKLSGQQNLQQRIHHHAKIKDENNLLKSRNEELGAKLRRTEAILSCVKEELARYRSSCGRDPYLDIDEEKRLKSKLEATEEERVQLAQKLLSLCTSILKAAGITRPVSEISPSVAEDALNQLMDQITSLERELQEAKFKNRISNERIRLSELRQQSSPLSSRANENCPITPSRALQIPSLSTLSETIDGERRLFNMDR